MISVVCWRWGDRFSARHVNILRAMLERNMHLPHQLWCLTDDFRGIDAAVRCLPLPLEFAGAFRCRRRMWQYAAERRALFGPRMLAIDLDVVIVDDLTSLVARPEPIVLWRVGYAGVYSGSFVLCDTGALDGAYRAYRDDPDRFLALTGERNASDQAMINHWLQASRTPVAELVDADGLVPWFGDGYEHLEHHGVGPTRGELPPGTRIVVFGSADLPALEAGVHPWIRECWK